MIITGKYTNEPLLDLWEILIPTTNHDVGEYHYKTYSIEHYREWEKFIKGILGEITIIRSAMGEWDNPDGVKHTERMIPVRLLCKLSDVDKIIEFTKKHYEQEVVMMYRISNHVIMK